MAASVDPLDEGLRILARIIARDWARRHLLKECAGNRADDETANQKSPVEAVPTA